MEKEYQIDSFEFSEKSKTHGVSIFDILTKYRQKTYN